MVGKALCAMAEYFGTDHERIGHSLKVHGYARAIALRESLSAEKTEVLECAALLHDIGIPESLRIFGSSRDKYRELMGIKVADVLLSGLNFPRDIMDEILFLIGHHHSYGTDGGLPLQILFEADTLVNLHEGTLSKSPEQLRNELFRTKTGRELLDAAFGIQPPPIRA